MDPILEVVSICSKYQKHLQTDTLQVFFRYLSSHTTLLTSQKVKSFRTSDSLH